MRLVGYLKKKSITMFGNVNVKFWQEFQFQLPCNDTWDKLMQIDEPAKWRNSYAIPSYRKIKHNILRTPDRDYRLQTGFIKRTERHVPYLLVISTSGRYTA
jgi:hypothetical protein